MDFYKAKVRLRGDVRHEVAKPRLSTPEIYILRFIHGEDAVVEIELAQKNVEVDAHEERQRLHRVYGEGLANLEKKTSVTEIFGQGFTPLPESLPEFRGREVHVAKEEKPQVSTAANPRRKKKITAPISVPAVTLPKEGVGANTDPLI
jgi:hypothetical protein